MNIIVTLIALAGLLLLQALCAFALAYLIYGCFWLAGGKGSKK